MDLDVHKCALGALRTHMATVTIGLSSGESLYVKFATEKYHCKIF